MFVCISTKNRNAFYNWTKYMVSRQTIPVKVVIVDGSESPSIWKSWPDAFYNHSPNIILGKSRNLAMSIALENGAKYISIWDDDDYYESWHLEKAIDLLNKDKYRKAVGSSLTPIYFQKYNELWNTGPFIKNHAIEPSLVFHADLAKTNLFNPEDSRGLGGYFLNNFTVPLIQMKGSHMIIAHGENTVNKDELRKIPSRYKAKQVDISGLPTILNQYPV